MLRAPEANPKRGGTLRWAGLANAPFFDIHQCETAACIFPMAPISENLLRGSPLDGGREIIPDLAYKWEVSPDGLTYTFHLRNGVKFHDGASLTSEDVKASFDHIIFPPTGVLSPRKPIFDAVKEVRALDPLTAQFVLTAPRGYFPDLIASGWNVIYRKQTLEENGQDLRKVKVPPGTGPFIFESFQPGQVWKLRKNPNYWNPELPYLDGLVFNNLPIGPAVSAALLSDQADYVFPAGPDLVDAAGKQADKMTTVVHANLNVQGGWINHEHKPFDDARVRQAINLVIDRCFLLKGVAEIILGTEGMWMPPTDVVFAKTYREATLNKKPGYRCPTAPEDIAAAKKLLAEAGYPDGKGFPKVDLMVRAQPNYVAWGSLFQGILKQHLNIDSSIRVVEFALWVQDQEKGNYDIGLNSINATLDHPAEYWKRWFGPGPFTWNKGASNPEFDALLGKMLAESDPQKVAPLVEQGVRILDAWVPMLPFAHPVTIEGWRNYVKGHDRKNRQGIFGDNRMDTIWLDK